MGQNSLTDSIPCALRNTLTQSIGTDRRRVSRQYPAPLEFLIMRHCRDENLKIHFHLEHVSGAKPSDTGYSTKRNQINETSSIKLRTPTLPSAFKSRQDCRCVCLQTSLLIRYIGVLDRKCPLDPVVAVYSAYWIQPTNGNAWLNIST